MPGRHLFITFILISAAVIPAACSSNSGSDAYSENGTPTWHAETRSVESFMPENVRRIYGRSCESCHGLNGTGIAGVAPDLHRIPGKSAGEWEKYLRDPNGAHPASAPPPVWMTAEEIRDFAEYLEVSRK